MWLRTRASCARTPPSTNRQRIITIAYAVTAVHEHLQWSTSEKKKIQQKQQEQMIYRVCLGWECMCQKRVPLLADSVNISFDPVSYLFMWVNFDSIAMCTLCRKVRKRALACKRDRTNKIDRDISIEFMNINRSNNYRFMTPVAHQLININLDFLAHSQSHHSVVSHTTIITIRNTCE